MLAEIDIDWGALLQVVYISAIAGILIATVLGVGITAQLRAEDSEGGGSVLGLHAVTIVSVLIVAAAVVTGIYFITDK
jgi:UPF0716 family protein affecting phage T7 exclusion